MTGATAGAVPSPAELRAGVAAWLDEHAAELPSPEPPDRSFAARVQSSRVLQLALFDAGWVRYGWPERVGGLGGGILHRAVVYEELAHRGYADRGMFEHVEILLPPLLARWTGAELARAVPPFLRGDELWCQGFSEPDAGSDLGSLRTRATRDGDEYRITGRKVWTSWAIHAEKCVVLARTGTMEERHRGLSAFMVDLGTPGVTVSGIRQANGHDELAEVLFDDVVVAATNRIGAVGDGWALTLEILSYERGTSSWLRQLLMQSRAEALAAIGRPDPFAFGDVVLDLYALRMAVIDAFVEEVAGTVAGPAAAPVKVLRTDTEQHLYELAERAFDPELVLGSPDAGLLGRWRDEYLFSRAVSIYGGTRQMQLNTIAKYVLGMGGA